MTTHFLQLTAHDPIVARDGRPFGVGQGNRMKVLGWPYPSVVAGSFRTALVKATEGRDFTGKTPQKLMEIPVAGVFPVTDGAVGELYLPAPTDCVVQETWREVDGKKETDYVAHPAVPADMKPGEGCDWPDELSLRPVVIAREGDFKPASGPAWWPARRLADWLTGKAIAFDRTFLSPAVLQLRDHVKLDADTGAAAESQLFATAGLSLTHLPRFGVKEGQRAEKYTGITLSARVEADGWNVSTLNMLHPLGGERRLVHWQANGNADLWSCPGDVEIALAGTTRIRMVLATPALFKHGWRPNWIDQKTLTGRPDWWPEGPNLTLVGLSIARWKAISGWSMQPQNDPDYPAKKIKPGPKPMRRLVPAGGVYFFKTSDNPTPLAKEWLQPVSDDLQDRKDGFGLAVWGTW